jgi:hypothetical protein
MKTSWCAQSGGRAAPPKSFVVEIVPPELL